MRILYRASVVLTAAFVILFSFGCDPDTGGVGGGGVVLGPTIQLNSGDELISFNQELPLATESFLVSISGNDGDNALENLTIQENGLTIPPSRLTYRTGQTSNNPILLLGDDASGFIYEVEIRPDVATAGDVTYDFRLEDITDRTANTSLIITYTSNPPLVELIPESGISGDAIITSILTDFNVGVQLSAGDDSIRTFTVLEDGEILDASRIIYLNPDFPAMNPLVLLPEEQVGISFNSLLIRPEDAVNTVRTYTFRATDANGVVGETTITITFETPTTDLTFNMAGVFFNSSDAASTGGLDLDTGTAVAFNSNDAELQDEGINTNQAGENWRTQVSDVNDAVLKIADLTVLGDGLTFDDVLLTSQIEQVFDAMESTIPNGDDDFPNTDGDEGNGEDVTPPLQEGNVLVVRRDGRTYLVRIDEINFVASSNDDNYVVSIKY